MTNLKEGQRIDVYEVVGRKSTSELVPHDISLGTHLINTNRVSKTLILGGWLMFPSEVRKVGTFIVKSLKGGSNE